MGREVIKELDLHRVRHEEVDRLVENFVLMNEPPLTIITGKSHIMRRLRRKAYIVLLTSLMSHIIKCWIIKTIRLIKIS